MRLSQIWTYPIKSCAGVSLERAALGGRGLLCDRHWMVVTPAGRMVTLREARELVLVRPRFAGDHLVVTAPDMPPLELAYCGAGPELRVKLWEGSGWFSRYLRRDVRLVRVAESRARTSDADAGSRRLSFADDSPLNILGEASLDNLNSRLASPVGVERFRPNLVYSGGEANAEDSWRQVRIGSVLFDVHGACERCMMVNVEPDAGYAKEPLATLAGYRRRGRDVLFSQNLSHLGEGELRVGDAVNVLRLKNTVQAIK